MPKFSPESFSRLSTCHIDLQTIFYQVIKNIDCTIIEGYRNQSDQEADFAAGKTKLHYPNGKHNAQPSMAVDAAMVPIDWDFSANFYYFAGFVKGVAEKLLEEGKITHGLRWGGNWNNDNDIKDNNFNDLVHFELIA